MVVLVVLLVLVRLVMVGLVIVYLCFSIVRLWGGERWFWVLYIIRVFRFFFVLVRGFRGFNRKMWGLYIGEFFIGLVWKGYLLFWYIFFWFNLDVGV